MASSTNSLPQTNNLMMINQPHVTTTRSSSPSSILNNNRAVRSTNSNNNYNYNNNNGFVENIPLIGGGGDDSMKSRSTLAPLNGGEEDDDDDGRDTVSTPQPGVDDGFFDNGKSPEEHDVHPDVEVFPIADDEVVVTTRAGPDGGSEGGNGKVPEERPDAPTDNDNNRPTPPTNLLPGFRPDIEFGGLFPTDFDSIPDVNVYQHKKTLAQGMMDLALFSANANQLRYVLESSSRHPYFYPSLVFLSLSIILQVAVGIGLIWNATYNVKDRREICIANRINNFTIVGIFVVTVVNVFISAFGVANPQAIPPS